MPPAHGAEGLLALLWNRWSSGRQAHPQLANGGSEGGGG